MYTVIAKKSFESLLQKRIALLQALVLPLFLLIFIEYYHTFEIAVLLGSYSVYLILAISIFINIIISITVHRILLLEKDPTPPWGIYKFGKRELNFILKACILGVIGILISIPVSIFSASMGLFYLKLMGEPIPPAYAMILFAVVGLLISIPFSRLFLVFPAVSIDKPIGFKDAFRLSKNYKMLLFVSIIVFPTFFALILSLVYGLAIGFLVSLISTKLSILYPLLNLFITIFTIAFLSTTYEYIMKEENKEENKEEVRIEETVEKKRVYTRPIKGIDISRDKDTFKVNIHESHNVSFDNLKKELEKQYEKLGFIENAIDREFKWMIKNPEDFYSYVLLCQRDEEFHIETFKTVEPELKLLKNN